MLMLKSYEERHYAFVTDRPEDQSTLKMILGGA